MKIALLGTRGVPANYGGFETAVEEIGRRLAARGHRVVVYCRGGDVTLSRYRGMDLVHVPAIPSRTLETLSHTFLSLPKLISDRPDCAVVFNAANALPSTVLKGMRIPFAIHVDGLEWKRSKWGRGGRLFYRASERLAVRLTPYLIADAEGISEYYSQNYGRSTLQISYGVDVDSVPQSNRLAEVGLASRGYNLVVARLEPENNVHLIVRGYSELPHPKHPLVIVGGVPYETVYHRDLFGRSSESIRFLGGIYDQELLNQLYANAATYLHGHSVGGTNPSLLRAAATGVPVVAFDTVFNREVLGKWGSYFVTTEELCEVLASEHLAPSLEQARDISRRYSWDDVTDKYEDMCAAMARTQGTRD